MAGRILRRFLLLALSASIPAASSDGEPVLPITAESIRLDALRTVFPGMRFIRGHRSTPTRSTGDAFTNEPAYLVIGPVMNDIEDCASDDVLCQMSHSKTRSVRFQIFQWPGERDDGLLVVLQYAFTKANPPMSCPSIGLLGHVVKQGDDGWRLRHEYLLDTVHHWTLPSMHIADLTGRGQEQLVVESDFGSAGVAGIGLQVFDLAHHRFDEALRVDSRVQAGTDDKYSQSLNEAKTRAAGGTKFCFDKSTEAKDGAIFSPPLITHPCSSRGTGVDYDDNKTGARLLKRTNRKQPPAP